MVGLTLTTFCLVDFAAHGLRSASQPASVFPPAVSLSRPLAGRVQATYLSPTPSPSTQRHNCPHALPLPPRKPPCTYSLPPTDVKP
jgi:hypothetical protein